ncbi:MAG: elongation factor P maturation arginine rhamnosyltransferase EarP [Spirochaetaceae bacterium]|nr:elongation factor P maturation arginine rhamnosyltransferase EarP [Spirochaetaceae bacterium]
MKLNNSDITLLCKVVDNYGDIGVVFRLAKALSALLPDGGAGLRLIVDNLEAFAQLSPGVDVKKPIQKHCGWTVCQWDAADEGRKMYAETPPLVILECFACGRPEWLDDILFDKSLQALRPKPVQIINLEYLTAEPYADEFHKLQSLTRSAQVRKVNFMPGFTDKTGGLILDGEVPVLRDSSCEPRRPTSTGETGATGNGASKPSSIPGDSANADKPFTFLIFSYERDFSTIADALAAFATNRDTRILVAAGKADAPFSAAWKVCADRAHSSATPNENPTGNAALPELEKLPFLPQEEWDKMLYSVDFLFIRGEDSLSRACLSGKPFVWHAYPQSEMYHLVKVQALLDRMEPFFSAENFRLIRDYWLWYNGAQAQNTTYGTTNSPNSTYDSRNALLKILSHYDEIHESFLAFSKNLIKNGNLAEHLMTFIEEIV